MFSPYPNKQRGQAFSPASSASSPAPSLAASLSRHGHHAPTQNDTKAAEATAAPSLSASTSKASSVSRPTPRKARPLFDTQLRPNISYIALPETTSTTPGWAIRWSKFTYASAANSPSTVSTGTSPAQDLRASVPPSKRQKLETQGSETDACRFSSPAAWLRSCASANTQSDNFEDAIERARRKIHSVIDDMRQDQQREAAVDEDPFGVATTDFEDGEVGEMPLTASSTSTSSPVITLNNARAPTPFVGIAPRSCLVQTSSDGQTVSRSLWVFELDERRCVMYPLPEDYEGLELVDSGLITYGSLYPSLVDKVSGYPAPLTAGNAPSALDLSRIEPHSPLFDAHSAFLQSLQQDLAAYLIEHHGLHHVDVRQCGPDVLLFPSLEQRSSAAEPTQAVAVSFIVSMKWEGVVLRSLQQSVPWCLASQSQELPIGSKVRLCPLGVEGLFKRRFPQDCTNEALCAKDKELIASTKAQFQRDAPHLVQDLPLESWVLVNWQDQDVLWPLDLLLVEVPSLQHDDKSSEDHQSALKPIEDIAAGSGEYVDGLFKDREQQRVKLAELANTPKEGTSPATPAASAAAEIQEPADTSLLSAETPSTSSAVSPAIQHLVQAPPLKLPVPQESEKAFGALHPMINADDPLPMFNGKAHTKPDRTEQASGWDGFAEDNDHDAGAFDDVLTGLTADDFSFFDAPSMPRAHDHGGSMPSNNIFNIFDNNNSLGSDNLFGDANPGFFAPSPQPAFSHSPASQQAHPGDHATPDLSALLPKMGSDQVNGYANSSEVSDQTAVSPNFSTLFGPSPAAANSPYKTPFTPFSTEDPSPPAPGAALPTQAAALSLATHSTPFVQPQPQWHLADGERFGPLAFSPSFVLSGGRQARSSVSAEDSENRNPSDKRRRGRQDFFTPVPWKTDAKASLSRSRLSPTIIPLKRLLQAEEDESESEGEDVLVPTVRHSIAFQVQENRKRAAANPLILGTHLLAMHHYQAPSLSNPLGCSQEPRSRVSTTSPLAELLLECPQATSTRRFATLPLATRRSATSTVKLPEAAQESLLVLQRPRIKIIRGDSVVSADMEALVSWSKLSFSPLSGSKDVHGVVLADARLQDRAESCLQTMAIAYTACNLGVHTSKQSAFDWCLEGSINPEKAKAICETLQHIAGKDKRVVCYLPADLAIEDFAALSASLTSQAGSTSLCLHPLVALQRGCRADMTAQQASAEARSVYDRFRRPSTTKATVGSAASPISPTGPAATPQQIMESLQGSQPGAYAPHFVLNPREQDGATFNLKWPPPSLDVLDRHRFLHVAYAVKPDEQQMAVIVCDDRGEMHLTETITLTTNQEQERVGKVWLYLHALLRKSSVEWRVVIAFVSEPKRLTLECWRACLGKILSDSPFACHFSLIDLQVHQPHQESSELVKVDRNPPKLHMSQRQTEDDGLIFRPQADVLLACNLLTHTPHSIRDQTPSASFKSIASVYFYASTGQDLASPQPQPVFSIHLLHTAQASSSILHRSLDQHMTDLATSLSDLVHLGRARQFSSSAVPFHAEFLSSRCFL